MTDVLVLGSGASGVHAAFPLVEANLKVTLIDYGNVDPLYAPLIPSAPFSEIRKSSEQQHRYLLGDRFEGIPFGSARVGAQLTPPRLHISQDVEKRLPIDSDTFFPTESLAVGGLGAGWGAGVFPFTDDDLRGMPLTVSDLQAHYDAVAERIGVSGDRDDLLPFYGDSQKLMPSLEVDSGAESVLRRYAKVRNKLNEKGFFLGRSRLAACSRPHRGRGAHSYGDMDFWSDQGRSVYRPQWTLEELKQFPNFTYLNRRLASHYQEHPAGEVRLHVRHADTDVIEIHSAHRLILAAGTLSTARIVLRSQAKYDRRIPLVCNPYTYVPCLNVNFFGQRARDLRHSLTQLCAVYRASDPSLPLVHAQYYSYRSLLTFKLMKETPLAIPESRALLQLLMPYFGILGVHSEDRPSALKYCALHRSETGPDRLEINYQQTAGEESQQYAMEKSFLRFFRKLRCFPLKSIRPRAGSSIHYAGTFPISTSGDELTCDRNCRLQGTKGVYLADGSVFAFLPAKGLTFTLMANANRVATNLVKELQR